MRLFSWRYMIYLAFATYLLADLCFCRGPLYRWMKSEIGPGNRGSQIVARVGDEKITLQELEEALRDHLWRRGGVWDALSAEEKEQIRAAVIDGLVNDRLIRMYRMNASPSFAEAGQVADNEMAMFVKQFDREGDFERRLGLRHLKEPELNSRMRDAIDDQAWIESKIAGRMRAVTDKDVSDWLRENHASMLVPPVYGVAHIYLTTHDAKKPDRETEIREIYRKLKAGEATFEQLALQYSDDERSKKIGGKLGWCARGRMPDDFMNVIEKLEEGETSEPVETKLGWHVIRLIDKKPGRVPAIEEVKSEVIALLRNQRRDAAVRDLVAELRAQSADSISMSRALIGTAEPP